MITNNAHSDWLIGREGVSVRESVRDSVSSSAQLSMVLFRTVTDPGFSTQPSKWMA